MMSRFTKKLKAQDESLYHRIEELDLKPQYYAFRWLTLLMSQEFPLPGIYFHKIKLLELQPLYEAWLMLLVSQEILSPKYLTQYTAFKIYLDR